MNRNIFQPDGTPMVPIFQYDESARQQVLKLSCQKKHKNNSLDDNSPESLNIISYRLGRKKQSTPVCPIDLKFKVQIRRIDYRWLTLIYTLLIIFTGIWFIGILSIFLRSIPIFYIITIFMSFPGFFGSTYVMIGFILIARTWFFHESSVYKFTSIKFSLLLFLLTAFSLLYAFLNCFLI